MESNTKKKSHNIILAIVLIILLVVIYIASSKTLNASANTGSTNVVTSNKNQALKLKRDNSEAKKITLGSGNYRVGKDITPGRYIIKAENGEGNVSLYKGSVETINEALGKGEAKTVTYTLLKDETLKVSGIEKVELIPTTNKATDTLTTGEWNVGLDVNPGKYIVTAKSGEGILEVYQDGKVAKSEKLSATGKTLERSTEVTLVDGETVNILGLKEVNLKVDN